MAEFQLYNSASKKKEVFKPIVEGKVGMYVCGVTVDDFSHIGHARTYVVFDVLYRYLRYLGYEVVYVRNFTDIDDKIIRRANEVGEESRELSGRFVGEFFRDMDDLQCLDPTHQPRVSYHIEEIKAMISEIISCGHAYAVAGDVFFSAADFPGYGALSGTGNPADFALWKAAKDGEEPHWDSSWGLGRPGCHIQCSAMSAHYLTHSFDIHGGAMDLISPHHENQIALSSVACPHTGVNYWMHTASVTINDEMAKSTANSFTIREVTKIYHPLALRHFLLGTHYRSPLNCSISQIEISSVAIFYIYQTLQNCEDALSLFSDEVCTEQVMHGSLLSQKEKVVLKKAQDCINSLHNQVKIKLGDDLQTRPILKDGLPEALRSINYCVNRLEIGLKQKQLAFAALLVDMVKEVKQVLGLLGLLSNASYAEVLRQLKDKALKRAGLSEFELFLLIEQRRRCRRYRASSSRGDEIRDDLASRGIALMKSKKQTLWRPCVPRQNTK